MTYTKILIFAVMVTYFLGFIVGGILTIIYPEHLGEWLTYVGTAAATAIAFNCWKAKAENVVKIRKGLNAEALKLKKEIEKMSFEEQQIYENVKMDVDTILSEMEGE